MSRQRGQPPRSKLCLFTEANRDPAFRNPPAWGNEPVSLMFWDVCGQNRKSVFSLFSEWPTHGDQRACRWMNNSKCPNVSWTCTSKAAVCLKVRWWPGADPCAVAWHAPGRKHEWTGCSSCDCSHWLLKIFPPTHSISYYLEQTGSSLRRDWSNTSRNVSICTYGMQNPP